jgi:hypothetical protein
VWKKCKKKDGDKELERGFKRSNVLGKIGRKKKSKYHCFGKSCCSSSWFCFLQQRLYPKVVSIAFYEFIEQSSVKCFVFSLT